MSRAFLASVVGTAGLSAGAGCGNSAKSDGQVVTAPEASDAAQAVSKNYSAEYSKKYANQMKKKRP